MMFSSNTRRTYYARFVSNQHHPRRHQMANPNQESVIWSVVNSRPTLRAFLEINTLFVEV